MFHKLKDTIYISFLFKLNFFFVYYNSVQDIVYTSLGRKILDLKQHFSINPKENFFSENCNLIWDEYVKSTVSIFSTMILVSFETKIKNLFSLAPVAYRNKLSSWFIDSRSLSFSELLRGIFARAGQRALVNSLHS